jgi:hypothetical protein
MAKLHKRGRWADLKECNVSNECKKNKYYHTRMLKESC